MDYMFNNASNFNQDISDWDVSNVVYMTAMFDGAVDLSDDNKCSIHTSFSSNDYWPYDWSDLCDPFQPETKDELKTAVGECIDDNQACAGLSQVARSISRERARISSLVNSASTRGLRTPYCLAASIPGL